MGKGKVIGTVAAAVVIPAAAVVGAIYILPLLNIRQATRCITSAIMLLLPQTAQYRSARRKCLATARNTPTL